MPSVSLAEKTPIALSDSLGTLRDETASKGMIHHQRFARGCLQKRFGSLLELLFHADDGE